jgi:catechol 2,3-dioxygenase-like lactoylglutathione lyase family enzyme
MDHAGVVVEDLAAAVAFFVELGLELEGEAAVEGEWVDQLLGLDGVRADIAVHGAELVGDVAQYGDIYPYCYVRGPDGIIIGLVEELR